MRDSREYLIVYFSYKNGFCIDDGEFRSADDPTNATFIEDVDKGLAPKELRDGATGPVNLLMEDKRYGFLIQK